MARPVKDLYMCEGLEDLQQRSKPTRLENSSAKLIISTAEKLFAEAEKAGLGGDEELSYLYYFRYIDAISTAQKKEDYKKEKKFYDTLISLKKFKRAIEELEKLSESLQRRYKLKKDAAEHDSLARRKEYNDALENEKNFKNKKAAASGGETKKADGAAKTIASVSGVNGIIKTKTNGVDKPGIENAGISPNELKNLLEQKTKRVLLVDCRDQQDYLNNRIKHSNCISIPATSLSQGISANIIQNILKDHNHESYVDWQKRGSFDCIILYDWNSSFDHQIPVLNIVYDALTKWDQECKNTKILVVQGGMKSMYFTYPSLLTNPHPGVSNASSNKVNGSNTDLGVLGKLEAISYPDLDDNSPDLPKPASVDGKNTTVNNFGFDVPNRVSSSNNNSNANFSKNLNIVNDVPKSGGIVPVDRSTKPTRLNSGQKIPNGVPNETMAVTSDLNIHNNLVESTVGSEKTEGKVKEYSKALDEVIESVKDVVISEKEILELKEKVNVQAYDKELENRLREKELETEKLKKVVESRNVELAMMKAKYEASLRENKMKNVLPQIRVPAEEEQVARKEEEKNKLDQMVKEMRKKRIEQTEKRNREQGLNLDQEKGPDSVSRLPPISSASSAHGGVSKGNVVGTPQLPTINNTVPTPSSTTSVPAIKPTSSNIVPPTVPTSRPVSQDSSGITRLKLKDEPSEPLRSSSLKRSHSHPNIAQSHDDDSNDDLTSTSQPPRINRGLKPSGNRSYPTEAVTTPSRRFARNFEVVGSTERSKTGLKNLGNTCYMNSIIQCLAHTNKLVDYLRKEEYVKEWHPSRSPTKGEATEELAAAVKQMHSGHRSISLLDLKSTVGKHHRSFRGCDQQDSHEFITIVLDWLHEEMNRAPEKTPLKEQKNDDLTDEVAAGKAWEDYKRSNDSKISELFCGQQKSCVTCGTCSRQSVTFEPFFILSVPIPISGRKCDIQQCIDFYTTEEELQGWNCVHCKRKVRATKKIDLWRLPPYLIIHLQRFYFDGYWKKRLTEIDFPVDNLNLNPKVLGRQTNIDRYASNDYQLYGVSNHYGSMDGGHYTAYCRQIGAGNWWKFDDQEVCPINPRDVPTPAAYILFYQNRNY